MQHSIARVRAVIVVALAALVAAIAAAAASAAPPVAPPADQGAAKAGQQPAELLPPGQAEKLKKQDALLPVARGLADQARGRGSDIAGVSIDVDNGVVHVFRTNPGKALGLAGAPPAGVTFDVQAAKFSRSAMIDAADKITQDAQLLGDQHVLVDAIGPNVDGSGIDVTVFADASSDVDRTSSVLHGRYGAIVHDVRGSDQKPAESQLYYGGFRFNDYAPWYGGDRIVSSSVGCSTGFAAVQNGAPAMLTAAHCGGVGTAFYNGPTTSSTYNYMGSSVYSNTNTDVNAIQVSSASNYINVGSALSPSQLYIGSWASPIVGQYLCQSGSYTGEVCGLRVVDTNQYVCLSYFLWFCTSWQGPLADVVNYLGSGSYAAGHGDSGGPVYLRSGSSGIAEGLVHGQLTPNAQSAYPSYFPDTMWCPAPEGWQMRCSAGFSFAHMPGF